MKLILIISWCLVFSGALSSQKVSANEPAELLGKPEVDCVSVAMNRKDKMKIEIRKLADEKLIAKIIKKHVKELLEYEVKKTQAGVQRNYSAEGFNLLIPLESFVKTKRHRSMLVLLEGKTTKMEFDCTDKF